MLCRRTWMLSIYNDAWTERNINFRNKDCGGKTSCLFPLLSLPTTVFMTRSVSSAKRVVKMCFHKNTFRVRSALFKVDPSPSNFPRAEGKKVKQSLKSTSKFPRIFCNRKGWSVLIPYYEWRQFLRPSRTHYPSFPSNWTHRPNKCFDEKINWGCFAAGLIGFWG